MKTDTTTNSQNTGLAADYIRRAYAAMRHWGDTDRDDEILEGACEVRALSEKEIGAAGRVLAELETFLTRNEVNVREFLPALLKEATGGAENLAMDYGITVPRCATSRREARTSAIRSLAKQC